MKIEPIAFESLGVRSQATLVETKDVRILIDPAVSLAPRRYGLPPHRIEVDTLVELAKKITEKAREADVLIVTHYHYDHHDPGYVVPKEIYRDKVVLVKNPESYINPSQGKVRAPKFLRAIKGLPKEISYADGKEYRFGNTRILVSHPVPHGADVRLGYVIQVFIKDGDSSVLFTSDVEGVPSEEHVKFTLDTKPNFLVIDGPLSYLVGRALTEDQLQVSVKNMERLAKSGLETMVVDHHVLRDLKYREVLSGLYDVAKSSGVKVTTAAEILGRETLQLEAKRRELFAQDNSPAKIPRNLASLLRIDQEG
ncbi:putative hydrolase of the metallo-beta-lactamase superfamily [Metallosphaera sedula]|uniref:UPF0282 protein Msed_0584 n=3 Tax=Metallosphaera TaxID=41980 RepID=Y584_METS5|nr:MULTISPECIES: MBL fold metallo-hydrolase [Metallosphaera]A4YEA7.1 RecName: Full=UPF0282 protein Msed_0584 [Metallosphaera sedula DSM 5348]ABP94759.1 Predicted hydrolase of the metallo-beta-lactamase superfamily [Metallosphaera sedula DSM 5348]AIM26746.1 putative hydrolase of the metallo-beta-lactamase superfamily [Metallosphaera sedula]AKV73701.1 hypothetical protein MsedA_0596 [Metallosphaera sedula]AKV75941.1 hypothetical protein MsedB_0596 [Metallosphaera sedula]AKV78192.1 hypothetical 